MDWSELKRNLKTNWDQVLHASVDLGRSIGDSAREMWRKSEPTRKSAAKHVRQTSAKASDGAKWLGNRSMDHAAAIGAFLSQPEMLKWLENLTKAPATVYDRAMDSEYLRTHIGGGNHRMFDGGHSLSGAWEQVSGASDTDSFAQEVVGYVSGLWKDMTTTSGLPFATWDRADYGDWADAASTNIPGIDKGYFQDLLSYDAFEVLSTGLGAVGVVFAFKTQDKKRLAEILGSMGIISILSANPIMGLAVIATAAYAYFVKKREVDGKALLHGGVMAATSMAVFAVLGLPLLVELVIAIALAVLVKRYILSRDDILDMVHARIKKVGTAALEQMRGKFDTFRMT